jgi:hypothetical protein
MMTHGGIYSLADRDIMSARLTALSATTPALDVPFLMTRAADAISFFFDYLLTERLTIPQNLISYLTLPGQGQTFTPLDEAIPSPTRLPAAFTFIGQFIDHDLTMNALNLFDDQTGPVLDESSPLIDLDSVYGPRDAGSPLYNGDKFALTTVGDGFDYVRGASGRAMIPDNRNDENQIVAQIQILLQRLHNTFIDGGMTFDAAKMETLFNWQSVVINDYLPKVVDNAVLAAVIAALDVPDYTQLKHHPLIDPATGAKIVSMPHEFAIGFRFGHSQIRDRYQLNPHHNIRLFDNQNPAPNDLRGGKPLPVGHVIDWPFFLNAGSAIHPHPARTSNRIDSKVTNVVFDLPASTIADDIKFIGNLGQRNLIRSSQIGLGSGEDLAELYDPGNADGLLLQPDEIEPNPARRALFKDDNDQTVPAKFRTPLWYYLLKEAELAASGRFGAAVTGFLGPIGSRLIAEVIAGGVYYNPDALNYLKQPWVSQLTGTNVVEFSDIVARAGGPNVGG